jgi:hypothetical protein
MVSYLFFGSKSIPVEQSVFPIFDDLKSTLTGLKSGSTLNAIAYWPEGPSTVIATGTPASTAESLNIRTKSLQGTLRLSTDGAN